MQRAANWFTHAKWLLIFVVLVWGAFFWVVGYADCRADGTNNVACGIVALFVAYLGVIFHILVLVISFLSWLLP